MARRSEAVVDASVAVKWFSEEEGTKAALELRESHIEGRMVLSAPNLIIYELANALRFKPGFDDAKVTRAISDILDLQIDFINPGRELMEKSAETAYLYDTTIYDSCYLALGELMGIEVITFDKKFYDKAKRSGILRII
jgi:predicted nucleic acid-binding protein